MVQKSNLSKNANIEICSSNPIFLKESTTEVILLYILECWLVIIFMRTKCFDNNIT